MGAEHNHAIEHRTSGNRRALMLALAITATFLVVEAIGGWLTGSLALIADAGHMLTDVAALALSLFAMYMASRPATHARTYGYQRMEILAAAVNGVALVAISAFIIWEAIGRFEEPEAVKSGPMLLVATAGLVANLVSMRLLARGRGESLNVRGAYLHVLGDLLGSIGAIAAALVILTTGWTQADPLISVVISVLIVISAWRLLRESVDVLMESTPPGVDVGEIETGLTSIPGVQCVHDMHVWTVTSGFVALSGHLSIFDPSDYNQVMVAAQNLLRERFGIDHATLQLETPDLEALLPDSHLPGAQPCLPGHVQPEMATHPH
ncbi:MAG: cation diffusion facilitator family transporter [Dehalococcoidia bacterium]